MKIYQTEDYDILTLYSYYQEVKNIISKLENLKIFLMDNKLIKEGNRYIVLYDDKYCRQSYNKYKKILFNKYISNKEFKDLLHIYNNTIDDIDRFNENEDVTEIFSRFNIYELKQIKNRLKSRIKFKLNPCLYTYMNLV